MIELDAWCDRLERDLVPWARVAAMFLCEGEQLRTLRSRRLVQRSLRGQALARTLASRREILLDAAVADAFGRALLEELRAEALLLLRDRGRLVVVAALVGLAPSARRDRRRLEAIGTRASVSLELVGDGSRDRPALVQTSQTNPG